MSDYVEKRFEPDIYEYIHTYIKYALRLIQVSVHFIIIIIIIFWLLVSALMAIFRPIFTIFTARTRTVRGSNPGGARFSAPVQTGPEAHSASCTMCTEGKVLPGRDADPSPPSSAEV